jgi:hypothetical protein
MRIITSSLSQYLNNHLFQKSDNNYFQEVPILNKNTPFGENVLLLFKDIKVSEIAQRVRLQIP